MMQIIRKNLLICGTHNNHEGYPNTVFVINYLKGIYAMDVIEISSPLIIKSMSKKSSGFLWKAKVILNVITKNIRQFFVYILYIWGNKSPEIIYIPYPSIFMAAFISFLPARIRPKVIILDAFISIYDTVINDREILHRKGWCARLLYLIERRAYRVSDCVIVDTTENALYLVELFKLPAIKFRSVPLSTDEANFQRTSYISPKKDNQCNILFIGTMIPLHGINVIANTIQQLKHRSDLHIQIIGDGQDSKYLDQIMPLPINVSWSREWKSSEEIAECIKNSDICLGIFGDGEKIQRVCPYKIYAYASIGRAIITGNTQWAKKAERLFGTAPFALVETNDSRALAEKIIELAGDSLERHRLAQDCHAFYKKFLSNEIAQENLMKIINDLDPTKLESSIHNCLKDC